MITKESIPQASPGRSGAIGGGILGGTAPGVLFIASPNVLSEDSTNFTWDNINKRLGIGTATPQFRIDVASTKSISSAIFTGPGLNDATSGGTYTGVNTGIYVVSIDNFDGVISTISDTPTSGGTGYIAGPDILTITTGGGNALVQVTAIGALGAITSVKLIAKGSGYSTGTGQATSGGHGTGATINITALNTNDTFEYTVGGVTIATAVPITGGTQNLVNGVTIAFGAATGHDGTESWTITATNTGVINTASAYNLGGNFLGTQTADSIYLGSGLIPGTGINNVFLGQQVGINGTNGHDNVFVGYASGTYNNSGYDNVFVGSETGTNNTANYGLGTNLASQVGYGNVFIGRNAGNQNSSGYGNVFVGYNTGVQNTSGYNNVFVGNNAGGDASTTGADNTFIGVYAGKVNTTGDQNLFAGGLSGVTNTTGRLNVFLGMGSGQLNTTGASNIFIGYVAGRYNTTASNSFFVNNIDQVNIAGDKAYSLLYGTFSGTANSLTGQQLTINGVANINSPQTTYTGSVTGTAIWSMPFAGATYKKFIIYFNALHDAGGTITYPTAFSKQPTLYGDSAVTAVSSTNTTTFTIAAASTLSGFVVVEGY